MFHHGAKLLSSLCFSTVAHVYIWITCVTWWLTCENPFVSLGSQLFSGGSCVLPVWHTYSSVFAWRTEVISAGFLLFWLVKFLWKSCGILVKIIGDPCENLGKSCVFLVKILCMLADCCGVIPPASAYKKSRLESWNRPRGCPRTLAPQRFHNITSDNHALSEQITCSLLKPQVSICACTVEYIAITYV